MVFLVCALMLLGLVGRLVYLMGIRSDYYYQKADEVIEVGTAGGSAAAISALESAVATNDSTAINNAIAGIYNSSGSSESSGSTESEE